MGPGLTLPGNNSLWNNTVAHQAATTQPSPVLANHGASDAWVPTPVPANNTPVVNNTTPTTPNTINQAPTYAQQQAAYAAQQAAAKAAQEAKVRGYLNDQVTGAQAYETQAGNTAGSTYNDQGRTLANTLNQVQTGINQKRVGIATSQINSIRNLVDTIKQGLQGEAVNLGNSNALDSSAANAVARIFSQYGNTQRNVINNDAAVQQNDQDTAQQQFNLQKDTGLVGLDNYKKTILDQIANDTISKLTAIDGMGQLQGVTGAVDVQGVKDAVLKNAQDKISQADQYVQGLVGGINPIAQGDIATKAYDLANRGVAGSGGITYQPINLNPAANLGGAPTAQLPLYMKPVTKQTS